MVKKYFVLHNKVIYVSYEIIYIPTIIKLSFHLASVIIPDSMECGKTRNYFHNNASKNIYKVKQRLLIKIQENKWNRNKTSTLR